MSKLSTLLVVLGATASGLPYRLHHHGDSLENIDRQISEATKDITEDDVNRMNKAEAKRERKRLRNIGAG